MRNLVSLCRDGADDNIGHLDYANVLGLNGFDRSDAVGLGVVSPKGVRAKLVPHLANVFGVVSGIQSDVYAAFATVELG